MDGRRAFDQFERSGAGWMPLVLMILVATILTGVTLAGVGSVESADPLPTATMETTGDE